MTPPPDENLTIDLHLRVSESTHLRLRQLGPGLAGAKPSTVAREALRIGLAQLELRAKAAGR